jgi:hypothetical protein
MPPQDGTVRPGYLVPCSRSGELADRMDCFTNIVVDEVGVEQPTLHQQR